MAWPKSICQTQAVYVKPNPHLATFDLREILSFYRNDIEHGYYSQHRRPLTSEMILGLRPRRTNISSFVGLLTSLHLQSEGLVSLRARGKEQNHRQRNERNTVIVTILLSPRKYSYKTTDLDCLHADSTYEHART